MKGPDDELRHWRMLGAVVWQVGVSLASAGTWRAAMYAAAVGLRQQSLAAPLTLLRSCFSLTNSLSIVGIAFCQAVSTAAFTQAITVRPAQHSGLPPILGNIVALPMSHLVAAAASFGGGGAASAALWGWSLGTPTGFGWLASVGCAAGIATLAWNLATMRHVILIAPLKESRAKQLKARAPEGATVALRLTGMTAAAVVAAAFISPAARSGSLISWSAAITATLLLCFLWDCGVTVCRAIFSEPLAFQRLYGPAAYSAMLAALSNNYAPLLQQLASQKLASVAWADPSLRSPLWADSSAATWHAAIGPCVSQVEAAASAVAEVTALAPAADGREREAAPAQWNQPVALLRRQAEHPWQLAIPPAASAAVLRVMTALGVAPPPDSLESQLRAGAQRTEWAMHTLAGFCVASIQEDHYGIAQLGDPGLPQIVQALSAARLAFGKAVRVASCAQARQLSSSNGASAADVLSEKAQSALQTVVKAFGTDECIRFVGAASGRPALGTRGELIDLLKQQG